MPISDDDKALAAKYRKIRERQNAAQREVVAKKRAAGLVQVSMWVPKEMLDKMAKAGSKRCGLFFDNAHVVFQLADQPWLAVHVRPVEGEKSPKFGSDEKK